MAHCLQLIFSSALGGPVEIKEICGRGSKTQSNECTPWNLFLVSINIIKSITHLLSCSINDPLLNTVIIVIWTEQHTHICHCTTRQIFSFLQKQADWQHSFSTERPAFLVGKKMSRNHLGRAHKELQQTNTTVKLFLGSEEHCAPRGWKFSTHSHHWAWANSFDVGRSAVRSLVLDLCQVIWRVLSCLMPLHHTFSNRLSVLILQGLSDHKGGFKWQK